MENRELVNTVVKNLEESSNKELVICLEFLSLDFEKTKDAIIKLTAHLDNTEMIYNKILKEYQKRTNVR